MLRKCYGNVTPAPQTLRLLDAPGKPSGLAVASKILGFMLDFRAKWSSRSSAYIKAMLVRKLTQTLTDINALTGFDFCHPASNLGGDLCLMGFLVRLVEWSAGFNRHFLHRLRLELFNPNITVWQMGDQFQIAANGFNETAERADLHITLTLKP